MPNTKTIRAGIAKLPKGPPLVIALTGATTGIGSYIIKTIARTFAKDGANLRVYVVGRNASRAQTLLKYGRETSPGSDWRFLQVSDLSLMSEVDSISQRIIKEEETSPFCGGPPRLDVLYMSQALSPMQPSNHKIKPNELPIGVPPPASYGVTTVRTYAVFMKTFFFEELAQKHAGRIAFTHIHPGLVDGPIFYSDVNPMWLRILWRVLKPLLSWYITSDERELGGGAYGVGQRGDENKYRVWNHAMEVLEGIEKKNSAK
ncbi:hypothetical protein P280DRAFT_424699 [Massarina eburnea CBS 473.64]|uniref:NAD(P)-binding protein n=1 Tax=Massarina eburnea CBS 473.64 TaxID=1395130 RepID=A0A6A6S4H6_9PLEO|nr:hypothetical protein P280DRAFT_424699 [Massarina eburnea CBS 473.64]